MLVRTHHDSELAVASPNPHDPTELRRVRAGDALVVVAVAAASIGALVVSEEPTARSVDGQAFVLLLLMAAPLAVRRRWPTSVVAIVGVVALVSFAVGYPGGPPTLPLLVALYSVAEAGHRWWTVSVTLVFAGGGLVFRAVVEADAPVGIALDSALFVFVSFLGDAVHSRRQLAEETRKRFRLAEVEREAESQRRVTEERLRIARELHDVMAHSVTTMSVQAGAALDALDHHSPDRARTVLASMRTASRQAMHELRATVSLLRDSGDDEPVRGPTPTLAQFDELITRVEQAGVQVELTRIGSARALPPAVELTAYRVAQEALTNVIRHAEASTARITLTFAPGRFTIQIEDDGRGPGSGVVAGFGLRGLQERVEAIGGTLRCRPAPAGGFRVRADLPTDEVTT